MSSTGLGSAVYCLEARYKDLTRLLGDTATAGAGMVCVGSRLRFTPCMARSPMFYSRLTTDMVEKREMVVTITDWEQVVEMINCT